MRSWAAQDASVASSIDIRPTPRGKNVQYMPSKSSVELDPHAGQVRSALSDATCSGMTVVVMQVVHRRCL
jgi:hypothetical protein